MINLKKKKRKGKIKSRKIGHAGLLKEQCIIFKKIIFFCKYDIRFWAVFIGNRRGQFYESYILKIFSMVQNYF